MQLFFLHFSLVYCFVTGKAGNMVSFYAKGKKSVKEGNPIIFKEVPVNEGGGFDAATGVFTAPVPGTYTFTASVCSTNSDVRACFTVDDTLYNYILGTQRATGTGSLSLQLKAGQKVFLLAGNYENNFDSNLLFFTGALVQPQLS
jgi:hypothetical protein